MSLQLETDRLILKEMCEADAPGMFELNNDPDVVHYTGDGPFDDMEEVVQFIRKYDQYQRYQMGRLNMFIKATGEYIGWCGLKYLNDKNEVDIGYRLMKRYWGKGYATEAAKVCLAYGFNTLGLDRIIGTAMKENKASINVFDKIGLKYSHDDTCGCQPGVVYAITKDEWK